MLKLLIFGFLAWLGWNIYKFLGTVKIQKTDSPENNKGEYENLDIQDAEFEDLDEDDTKS